MATTEPIAPDLLAATHLWMDTGRSVDERVDLLLTEMTLEEKVGQLGSRWSVTSPRKSAIPSAPGRGCES